MNTLVLQTKNWEPLYTLDNIQKTCIISKIKSKRNTMTDNDFIEFINEMEPEITICGITFSPGDILKEMDPIAFRCFKSDYEADMEENEAD